MFIICLNVFDVRLHVYSLLLTHAHDMHACIYTLSGMVEYNFAQFKTAILQLFEAKEKFQTEHDAVDEGKSNAEALN
jgi:hypothetical protein